MNMKSLILFVFSIFLCFEVFALDTSLPDSFQNYQMIVVKTNGDAQNGLLYIPPNIEYKLVTKKEYTSENDVVYFKVGKIKFEIFYGQGPSAGGLFSISADVNSQIFKEAIVAEKIIISESGNIYTESRFGFYFNKKRKFTINKSGIIEQIQPFYSIDQLCKVNESLEIMTQRCFDGEVIATIPKGMSVYVILAERPQPGTCQKGTNFLVRTSFGLVGWACTTPGHITYGPPPQIDCLRYDGP